MIGARYATAALCAASAFTATGCEAMLDLGDPSLAVICNDGRPKLARSFVIDSFEAPTDNDAIARVSFDIDGDGARDNVVFESLVSFEAAVPELALQPAINSLLTGGSLIQLLDVQLGDTCAETTLYLGEDRDLPVDPTDNFSGEESFKIVGNARGRMTGGRYDDAVFSGPHGTAELRLPLFGTASPIDLPLVEAQVRYLVTDDGAIEGAIGGAIRGDVIDGLVLPSLRMALQDVVTRDCAGGTPPVCCPDGSGGRVVLSVFDDNQNCVVEIDEVRDDDLIQQIFAPDVDLYNGGILQPDVDGVDDAASIAVGFTAVNGYFLLP